MTKPMIYWKIKKLDEQGATINIAYGERANGKSFQVKHEKGINNYMFETPSYFDSYKDKGNVLEMLIPSGKKFVLLRRWKEEISTEKIEQYFGDVDVVKITDGKYNCISMYKKRLFLANYNNENGKTTRGELIGYVCALSTEQNYAGGSYLDVTDIIFEEWMTRSTYIANEPDRFMNFYSTIDRKKGTTRVWMVGNSISRVSPYISEWNLHDIFSNLKQGQIASKWIPTGDVDDEGIPIEIKIAVEYCESTGRSSYIIGKHSAMLNKGDWQSEPQPHLPKSINCYKIMMTIGFQYLDFKFKGNYLFDKETKETCWFIYPFKGEFKNNMIVFSDVVKISKYWQRDIYNPLINNDKIKRVLQTFRENQIFYATDLCGTDFKQCIDFEIRK